MTDIETHTDTFYEWMAVKYWERINQGNFPYRYRSKLVPHFILETTTHLSGDPDEATGK